MRASSVVVLVLLGTCASSCSLFFALTGPVGPSSVDGGVPADTGIVMVDAGQRDSGAEASADAGDDGRDGGAAKPDSGMTATTDGGTGIVDAGNQDGGMSGEANDGGRDAGGRVFDAGKNDAGGEVMDAGMTGTMDAGNAACGGAEIVGVRLGSLGGGVKSTSYTLDDFMVPEAAAPVVLIVAVNSEVVFGEGITCAIDAATFGGEALTRDAFSLQDGATNKCTALFSTARNGAETANIVVTTGVDSESINVIAYVATCVDPAAVATAEGQASVMQATELETNITISTAGAVLVVDAFGHGASVEASLAPASPGQLIIGQLQTANNVPPLDATATVGASYRFVEGPASVSMSWTSADDNFLTHVIVAFPVRP